MAVTSISPQDLDQKIKSQEALELIDVRTPVEFQEIHAVSAKNIPLDRLDPASLLAERNGTANEPVYVICKSGGRAAMACEKLDKAGHPNVVNVQGGTEAWAQAGLPVKTGKKAMSLERQVRIAAGGLVLAGVLLGAFVHPYCYGLSGFVGAGLMFAGITDTCAMGMLISKMPWNQVKSSCSS